MASLIGCNGMPRVFAFQFWATRGQGPVGLGGGALPLSLPGPPNWFGQYNYGSMDALLPANTGDQLWGETVTVNVAQKSQVFEFVDVGAPPTIPGAIAVEVASGATAADVASETAIVIAAWILATFGAAVGMTVATVPEPSRVTIASFMPGLCVAMSIATSAPLLISVHQPKTNKPYGAYVLRSAWKAFVCTGNANPPDVAMDLQDVSMFWFTTGIIGARLVPRWAEVLQVYPKALGEDPE